jgi:hypothetical protein
MIFYSYELWFLTKICSSDLCYTQEKLFVEFGVHIESFRKQITFTEMYIVSCNFKQMSAGFNGHSSSW